MKRAYVFTKKQFLFKKCHDDSQKTALQVECEHCKKQFTKTLYQISKSKNNFCSRSCSATLNNVLYPRQNNVRSNLEIDIQKSIETNFPDLEVLYNSR